MDPPGNSEILTFSVGTFLASWVGCGPSDGADIT